LEEKHPFFVQIYDFYPTFGRKTASAIPLIFWLQRYEKLSKYEKNGRKINIFGKKFAKPSISGIYLQKKFRFLAKNLQKPQKCGHICKKI